MAGREMGIFREIFCWWDGNTWGTRLTIWNQGRFVGKDDFGNRYYEQKKGEGFLGKPRRWVTYTDLAEPSKVPADWHGWLHHTVDVPPTKEAYQPRPWQRPHRMNMTGTPQAYRPPGSILASGKRPKGTGDYKAWQPKD
jgi:NADH:ubiquinone oxidoreductase subunit